MKRILIAIMLSLSAACFTGCPATTVAPTGTVATPGILSDQTVNITQKVLIGFGTLLQATPGTLEALFESNKITKDQYNAAVPIYNKVLVGWNAAVSALVIGASSDTYNAAFNAMMADKADLDAIIAEVKGGVK